MKEEVKDSKFNYFLKEWVIPLGIIVIIVVLIRTFIITPGVVNGSSMEDTLFDGDIVLVNKIALKKGIKRFDIVVINYDGGTIIKRVIGLPGETVKYAGNVLYINGEEVKTPKEFEYTEDVTLEAGKNEYIVLGDNRNVSKDSRVIGPINIKNIKGKVSIQIFPFKNAGKIE